jgi:hypothetical protein
MVNLDHIDDVLQHPENDGGNIDVGNVLFNKNRTNRILSNSIWYEKFDDTITFSGEWQSNGNGAFRQFTISLPPEAFYINSSYQPVTTLKKSEDNIIALEGITGSYDSMFILLRAGFGPQIKKKFAWPGPSSLILTKSDLKNMPSGPTRDLQFHVFRYYNQVIEGKKYLLECSAKLWVYVSVED